MTIEYWKTRCELAEKYIDESPCDLDITSEQINAFNEYNRFLKEEKPITEESIKERIDYFADKLKGRKLTPSQLIENAKWPINHI